MAILSATSHETASSSEVRASTEPCIMDDTCDCFDASRPCVPDGWMDGWIAGLCDPCASFHEAESVAVTVLERLLTPHITSSCLCLPLIPF